MKSKLSIAYRMAIRIVILTLVLGVIMGTFQVYLSHQERFEEFDGQIRQLLKSVEKSATKAVYTFDTSLADEVTFGLFEFKPITKAIIIDEHDQVMSTLERFKGELPFHPVSDFFFQQQYHYTVPLFTKELNNHQVGILEIIATPHELVDRFFTRAMIILGSTLVESFIIALVLLLIFNKQVAKPLQSLSENFAKINPAKPQIEKLENRSFERSTEFAELIESGQRMLSAISDHIEERKVAQADLLKQKNETERYLDIAEAIILRLDKDGRITMINQRGLDVLEYQQHEIIGQNWFDVVVPEHERATLLNHFQKLMDKEDESKYFENTVLTKTGQERHIFWHNAIEIDALNNATSMLSSGQDITARKEAEDALKATEGSLRAIIEATSEGFAISELDKMMMIDINSALHKMLGYERHEMLNVPIVNFIHPDDWPVMKSNVSDANQSPHRSYEVRLIRKDGTTFPVEINASMLTLPTDPIPKSVAFVTDITRRKEQETKQKGLERQLLQAQKMETIGTLAGGIAHDFNNILTPILGYASLLSTRISEEDPNFKRIMEIAQSARRGADIIKQLLSFSRRNDSKMESVDLSATIEETIKLVRATSPANINIITDKKDNCPLIIGDETQIQQLLLNLCTNAVHAMENNDGRLEISIGETMVLADQANYSARLQEGKHLEIKIRDNGKGMDKETQERIFDPFFTTKKSGQGTGLGLAMVHSIVEEHKGDIFVESKLDQGTTFTILIPATDEQAVVKETQDPLQSGNQEYALIVDDEPLNTNFLEELLSECGYRFESYNNAPEALEAFKTNPNKYQIVLTDQTMPHMTGGQLALNIRKISPQTPIIMMSGYDQHITPENAQEYGIDIFIPKPVTIEALTKTMHELLN